MKKLIADTLDDFINFIISQPNASTTPPLITLQKQVMDVKKITLKKTSTDEDIKKSIDKIKRTPHPKINIKMDIVKKELLNILESGTETPKTAFKNEPTFKNDTSTIFKNDTSTIFKNESSTSKDTGKSSMPKYTDKPSIPKDTDKPSFKNLFGDIYSHLSSHINQILGPVKSELIDPIMDIGKTTFKYFSDIEKYNQKNEEIDLIEQHKEEAHEDAESIMDLLRTGFGQSHKTGFQATWKALEKHDTYDKDDEKTAKHTGGILSFFNSMFKRDKRTTDRFDRGGDGGGGGGLLQNILGETIGGILGGIFGNKVGKIPGKGGILGKIGGIFGKGSKAGGIISTIGNVGSKTGGMLSKAGGKIGSIGGVIGKKVPYLGGLLAAGSTLSETGSIGQAVGSGTGMLGGMAIGGMVGGPVGLIVGAILGPILSYIGKEIGGKIKEVFKPFEPTIQSIKEYIISSLELFKSLWELGSSIITPIVDLMKSLSSTLVGWLFPSIKNTSNEMATSLSSTITSWSDTIKNITNGIKKVTEFIETIKNDSFFNVIKEKLLEFKDYIISMIPGGKFISGIINRNSEEANQKRLEKLKSERDKLLLEYEKAPEKSFFKTTKEIYKINIDKKNKQIAEIENPDNPINNISSAKDNILLEQNIPGAATGGLIGKTGLVNVHAGEVIGPLKDVRNIIQTETFNEFEEYVSSNKNNQIVNDEFKKFNKVIIETDKNIIINSKDIILSAIDTSKFNTQLFTNESKKVSENVLSADTNENIISKKVSENVLSAINTNKFNTNENIISKKVSENVLSAINTDKFSTQLFTNESKKVDESVLSATNTNKFNTNENIISKKVSENVLSAVDTNKFNTINIKLINSEDIINRGSGFKTTFDDNALDTIKGEEEDKSIIEDAIKGVKELKSFKGNMFANLIAPLKGVLGKLSWPLMILSSVGDFIDGFIKTEGNLFDKVSGGLRSSVMSFLQLPIDFIGWVTEKTLSLFGFEITGISEKISKGFEKLFFFGFDDIAKKLLDFKDYIGGLIPSPKLLLNVFRKTPEEKIAIIDRDIEILKETQGKAKSKSEQKWWDFKATKEDLQKKIERKEMEKQGMLGKISEKYESGGRGVGTVSTGIGDYGGVSYGKHQMASRGGQNSTVGKYIKDSKYSKEFEGLTPGTKEFSNKWKEIAKREPELFAEEQQNFIKKTHYDPLVNKVLNDTGFNLDERSDAVKEAVYSVGVQHGPSSELINRALKDKDLEKITDEELIKSIYQERSKRDDKGNLAYFKSSSKGVQEGVANRFVNEESDVLSQLSAEPRFDSTNIERYEKDIENNKIAKENKNIQIAERNNQLLENNAVKMQKGMDSIKEVNNNNSSNSVAMINNDKNNVPTNIENLSILLTNAGWI